MLRRFACLLAMLTTVLLAGCGGGGGGALADPNPTPSNLPSGLQYEQPSVVYTEGQTIAPNQPSSTGAAITHYSVSPSLPAGLELDADTGVISGTPTTESLPANYTVTGSNAAGSTEAVVHIEVAAAQEQEPPVSLNYDVQSADYQAGVPIAPNMPHPVGGAVTHYAVAPSLPAGLTLSETTGVISGTPAPVFGVSQRYDVTVTGSNSAGAAKENLTIEIKPENVPPAAPENLHYAVSWAAYAVGEAIETNVAHHDGGEIVGYSVSPQLPAGLTLDPGTGDISGVPAVASASTTYTVTGEGADGSGAAVTSITLQVVPPGTWVPTAGPMHDARYGAVQVTLLDGRVLVAGGRDASGNTLASAELYDPGTGEWTETSPMTTPRYGAMSILLPGGKVLVAGGSGANGALASAEIFDPSNASAPTAWQSTGSMNGPHSGTGMTMLGNGNVVVAGGSNGGTILRTVEIYNVVAGTWTYGKALNTATTGVSPFSMQSGGQVVVAGGQDSFGRAQSRVQVSSDPTSSWSNATLAGPARSQYGAIAMNDNAALLLGGLNGSSQTAVDLYNASTASSTSVTPLSAARSLPLIAPLDATRVLIAGGKAGASGGQGINSAEVYTFAPSAPVVTADAPTSPMSVIRVEGGISSLQDGHVLVSGGWDNTQGSGLYWNTSELYVP